MEKGVQDTRRRIWQEADDEDFASFAAFNAWLARRCRDAWDAPAGVTIREAWEQERAHRMPMPTPFDGYVELPARVSSTSQVSVARNRYSMPCAWAGHRVSVRLYPDRVVVVADHDVIAEHPRAVDRDQVSYDWQHYLPLVERMAHNDRQDGSMRISTVREFRANVQRLLRSKTPILVTRRGRPAGWNLLSAAGKRRCQSS